MPYFCNDAINVLYIHIPKTGGTTIERYFSKKYGIPLCPAAFHGFDRTFSNISLQHQTLATIRTVRDIDMDNTLVFASVRNPYTRLLSQLYYAHGINPSMPVNKVEYIMKSIFKEYDADNHVHDNHFLPQHLFVTDPRVTIVKQETLSNNMKALGFQGFEAEPRSMVYSFQPTLRKTFFHQRAWSRPKAINYFKQINMNIVEIVNRYYKEDFVQFNYPMITSEDELTQLQKT